MTISNSMIEKQLQHRTIREFQDREVPEEIFQTLMEVARRTATSNGMQSYSIIRITDPQKKNAISEICNQEYVARAPILLIFIVDQFRNNEILREKGCDSENAGDMDRFTQGFTDACIAAQNVVNAAEALDLGTNYLGSILNDSEKLCEILKLPQLTFPVVGLGIGYPNQDPQLKPRLNNRMRVFENEYYVFDNYLEEIKDYDQEMTNYYDLRNANQRVDCFSDQVVNKTSNSIAKRQKILEVIKKQGFQVKQKNS